MSRLIEELKKEHHQIIATLKEVKRLGISTKEGQNMLLSAQRYLLAHLKKEDEHIYPFLNNAAATNSDLKQTLELYAKNMDEISHIALEFFEKYSKGGSGIEFGKDFGTLYTTLSLRIAKEEAAIYDKFKEMRLL